MLTYPTFVHLCLIKEGYRPNETLHYSTEQSEMNGYMSNRYLIDVAFQMKVAIQSGVPFTHNTKTMRDVYIIHVNITFASLKD